jgi:hypothetical protein
VRLSQALQSRCYPANCKVLQPPEARVLATLLAGVQSSNACEIALLCCEWPLPAAIQGRCRFCCPRCPRRGCRVCPRRLRGDGDGRATIRASPCGSPAHETERRAAGLCAWRRRCGAATAQPQPKNRQPPRSPSRAQAITARSGPNTLQCHTAEHASPLPRGCGATILASGIYAAAG